MKQILHIIATMLAVTFLMVGCTHKKSSDSGTTSGVSENISTGVFLDARVNGLYYKTQTQSGFTSDGGLFTYKKGESVDFYLGDNTDGMKIGSSIGKSIVTPYDIDAKVEDNAVNIVRLLLSVSTASNDDMNISKRTRDLFQNSNFKDKEYLNLIQEKGFYYDVDSNYSTPLGDFIVNNNISTKIYDASEAKGHFSNTISKLTPKIGILINLQDPINRDVNKTLIPLVKKDIQYYLKSENIVFKDVDLILKDTKNDPTLALEELATFKNMGIKIVIGPTSSSVAKELLDYANKNDMILISPSSTAPSLSIKNDNLYRTVANDAQQAKALATLIASNKNVQYVLPIYRNDTFGSDYYKVLKSNFENNSSIVLLDAIKSDDNNLMQDSENELKNYDQNASAVLLIDFHDDAKKILDKGRSSQLLSSVKWFSNNALINIDLNSSLQSMANKVHLSGVTYTTDDSDVFVYYRNIVSKLKEHGVAKVDPFVVNLWDTIWLATEVYSKNQDILGFNKDTNSTDVIQYIKEVLPPLASKTYGATGFMAFDAYGDKEGSNFSYYSFTNNKWNNIGIYKHKPFEPDVINIHPVASNAVVHKNVKVGVIINDAYWNRPSKQLIELAKERINKYYSDKHIDFNVSIDMSENNATNVDKFTTLEELQTYHNQGINTIITIVPSRSLDLMQDYANENNMYLIDCSSTAPSLAKDDTTYRLMPNDNGEVEALVSELQRKNIENVVLISVNDIYGNDYVNAFKKEFKGSILKNITFESGTYLNQDDLTTELSSIKTNNYAVVYVALNDEGIEFDNINSTLKSKKWYGSGSSAFNANIANSGLDYTFLTYSDKGLGFFMPQEYNLEAEVNNSKIDMTNILAYDSMYLASVANYDAVDLNETLHTSLVNRSRSMYGISFFLGTDINGDRATLSYAFYSLINKTWKLSAIYNNAAYGIVDIDDE